MSKGLSNILEEVIAEFRPYLLERRFVEKGKRSFVRKIKSDFNREEKITFSARLHRSDSNTIYVACTIGLYYPSVKKIESFFITDHLSKYPILAGSISHFSESNMFLSLPYKTEVNLTDVAEEIKCELEVGAFNLINTFPTLESIYLGIINKHPFLYKFYNSYQEREVLMATCIVLLLYGKDTALEWAQENFSEGSYKNGVIDRLLANGQK